jgi:hypothetical protein
MTRGGWCGGLQEMVLKERGLATKEGAALQAAKTWPALVKLYHLEGACASQRPPWEGAVYAALPPATCLSLTSVTSVTSVTAAAAAAAPDAAQADRKRPLSPAATPTEAGGKAPCVATHEPR